MTPVPDFPELLRHRIERAGLPPRSLGPGECSTRDRRPCRLCHAARLTYDQEVPLKQAALDEFWSGACPAGPALRHLLPSPQGRGYRTVTKRKVFPDGRRRILGLIDPEADRAGGGLDVVSCAIEPALHGAIYASAAAQINRPPCATLAAHLRYVIVRGGADGPAVIFSVDAITPHIVRESNGVSRALTAAVPSITGVFLFEDTSDGRYYLGSGVAPSGQAFRKLFGANEVTVRIAGGRYSFHPLAFSQVNAEAAGTMVQTAADLLRPARDHRLLDLYSGYGLFALALAPSTGQVTGVESSPHSVAAAVANARARGITHARFHRDNVTGESIPRWGGPPGPRDLVILDPPRGGTGTQVIEAVAARRPARILHIFCNTEVIGKELERWQRNGYTVTAAVPVDMFPGTAVVEIMVLLERPQ